MDGQALARVLPPALEMGLRHIDTAQIYRNEAAVGDLALTRTSRADRLEQYRGLFNFTLGRDHMAAIATLGVRHERIVNPAGLTPIWDVPGPPQ